jgi:hypothetical protein
MLFDGESSGLGLFSSSAKLSGFQEYQPVAGLKEFCSLMM